jgi:hypothetical protein
MARVADYLILQDNWKLEMNDPTNPVKFNVPANVHTGSRSVLTFVHKGSSSYPMVMNMLINGTVVWTWKTDGSYEAPMRSIQEVVEANLLKPGENLLQWETHGSWRYNEVSDIVLWIQVET